MLLAWLACALPFFACAGPEPYQLDKLDEAQMARCRDLEQAYRSNAPEYPGLRDELLQDPVAIAWIVRMFVNDVVNAREDRPLGGDEELLRAAAGFANPTEARAIGEIEALGAVAVPTLVGDLLLHDQPHLREYGIELLARVGEPAVPALQEVTKTGEPRQQRAAARALGHIGASGSVLLILRELASSSDFTVRADALRSLHKGGVEARTLLIERMMADEDLFVRRVAAKTLAHYPDAVAAGALVDYLERSKQALDWPGENAAQGSLQAIARTRRPRTVAAWRAFVAQLEARNPPR